MITSRWTIAALAAAALFTTACRDRDRRFNTPDGDVTFARRDSTRRLGPGDMRIVTTDSSIELALVGDSIVAGLGTRVLNKVRDKTDTMAVTGDGIGASIERMVKSTVANAMNHEIHYPISAISEMRYDDGKLEMFGNNGRRLRLFENTHANGQRVSEAFDPVEAQRFVAAFQARKATRTAARTR